MKAKTFLSTYVVKPANAEKTNRITSNLITVSIMKPVVEHMLYTFFIDTFANLYFEVKILSRSKLLSKVGK